jgi:GNAT acetyltransferase-like protein
VKVEPWLEDDDAAWDDLCGARAEVLQTSAASRAAAVFGAKTRRIRVLAGDGRPLAAVALLEIGSRRAPAADRAFVRTLQVQGGPLLLDESPDAPAAALAGVVEFAEMRGAVQTSWKPLWPGVSARLPFAAAGWTVKRVGTAWRTLPAHASEVIGTFDGAHRSAARQAEREGMTVRPAASLDEAASLVDASMVRAGLPPRNREFMARLHEGLAGAGAASLLVCDDAQGPAASLVGARCGDAAFILFAGRAERPTRGAANLLHLRFLEQAAAGGARRAHDSDAGLAEGPCEPVPEGITRFKRLMGFRVDPCEIATMVHRPVARRVRSAALSVYRRLRGGP